MCEGYRTRNRLNCKGKMIIIELAGFGTWVAHFIGKT